VVLVTDRMRILELEAEVARLTKTIVDYEKNIDEQEKKCSEIIMLQQATIDEQAIVIRELMARLNMNSGNSSKPPSSDAFKKPKQKSLRVGSGKAPGGQEGHKGHGFKLPEYVDDVVEAAPSTCGGCGTDLRNESGKVESSRYQMDIPEIVMRTVRYDKIKKNCPCCGKKNLGEFPEGVDGLKQYGPNLKALAVTLVNYGMVSIERTQEILEGVLGVVISQGTIQNFIYGCAEAVSGTVEEIRKEVTKSYTAHFDETGFRVEGKLAWLHSASTDRLTHITVHGKRGSEGMEAGGVLPEYEGIAVHDCLRAYFKFGCLHALCNAHLLRELVAALENTKQRWAESFIKLLLLIKEQVEKYKESGAECLPPSLLEEHEREWDRLVAAGFSLNPYPVRKEGQKGRLAKGKTLCLLERLASYKENFMFFARDFRVPFDNNQAERDIRIAKLKQKVAGGLRSACGATAFAKITSYIQTARKQGISIFKALRSAFMGQSWSVVFDY